MHCDWSGLKIVFYHFPCNHTVSLELCIASVLSDVQEKSEADVRHIASVGNDVSAADFRSVSRIILSRNATNEFVKIVLSQCCTLSSLRCFQNVLQAAINDKLLFLVLRQARRFVFGNTMSSTVLRAGKSVPQFWTLSARVVSAILSVLFIRPPLSRSMRERYKQELVWHAGCGEGKVSPNG